MKKVRYKLLGGTPFAKTDIDEVRENEPPPCGIWDRGQQKPGEVVHGVKYTVIEGQVQPSPK